MPRRPPTRRRRRGLCGAHIRDVDPGRSRRVPAAGRGVRRSTSGATSGADPYCQSTTRSQDRPSGSRPLYRRPPPRRGSRARRVPFVVLSCLRRYDSLFADRPPLPPRRARETDRHGPARDAKRGRGGMACGVLSGERVRVSARAARPCEHAARCGARSTHLSRLLSTPGRNQIDHKTRSRAREANGRVTE